MFLRLLLLFTLIPLLELYLLIRVGTLVGVWPTVGLVFFTGVVGAYLARREGLSVLNRIRSKVRTGKTPTDELLQAAVVLVAGALLLTPGLLTDLLGFAGLIPQTRRLIAKKGWKVLKRRWLSQFQNSNTSKYDRDVDFNERE
ncbi:MAG: FxsA family protein [Candidatus Bipolaricaulota bacterium]